MSKPGTTSDWIDGLQASGRYAFTLEDAEQGRRGSRVAVKNALRRLKQKGRIASPRRGFFVIVPTEYRAAGCPPASWFIDGLMGHLGLSYYVGILSAASVHGAAHQQPMTFQVIGDRATRPMQAGRVHIEVHMSRAASEMPVTAVQTETGTMTVATPETTAFDLVRYPAAAGHWSNVGTVLSELAERISGERLVEVANLVRLPDAQRLGYLLELLRCHYNFCHPHASLRFGDEVRTPVMQAGLASRKLSLRDIFTARIVPLRFAVVEPARGAYHEGRGVTSWAA